MRQARWQEFLSRFHFKWEYRQGVNNPADPLSRRHDLNCCLSFDRQFAHSMQVRQERLRLNALTRGARRKAKPPPYTDVSDSESDEDNVPVNNMPPIMSWPEKIKNAYAKDPAFADPAFTAELVGEDGLWYKEHKIMIPDADDLRKQLLHELHDSPYSGHCGISKTIRLLQKHYYWPNMIQEATNYVRSCHTCQKNKVK